jgi:hypothetical protein
MSNASRVESQHVSTLQATKWDVIVLYPCVVEMSDGLLKKHAAHIYNLQIGISSKLLAGYKSRNKSLLDHTAPKPQLTGSLDKPPTAESSKNLELTPDLRAWFSSPDGLKTPPSMLNFLTFNPGMHDSYVLYGQTFAKDVGIRRGGIAKIVGRVVADAPEQGGKVWDEIAVAHYPSVWHFADMIMGDDYQGVNERYRVPALRGSGILCCDELDREILEGKAAALSLKSKM